MRRLNIKVVIHLLGLLMLCNGGFMLFASVVSALYQDGATIALTISAFTVLLLGVLAMYATRKRNTDFKKREGYLIVAMGWVIMALTGTAPYLLSGAIPHFTDAFFETMSGYTTTGASVLTDIESLPEGILFWRSLTHWIGGMGIIVLAIAILPLLGIGGMQLFAAESPGPSTDKLHPRITDTAKRLWLIYVGYTVAETLLLYIAGMNLFDAINHAMSTLSTGGFSTKNSSVAYWDDDPLIQYIIILFMFLAGSNFVLSYFAFKGNVRKILENQEFQAYVIGILGFVALSVVIIIYVGVFQTDGGFWVELEAALRHSLFQVVAVITTTGFVTADYTSWTPFLSLLFFGLMFLGGSAGSTAGGIKVVRHLIMIKNGLLEFKRSLHPNAIIPLRYNGNAVSEHIVYNVLGFFILYMLSFAIGAMVLGFFGLDFETALGGAVSTLGNVGPAFGSLGPVDNYAHLHDVSKLWCTLLMLIGRLELFTVIIIFSPVFWRSR